MKLTYNTMLLVDENLREWEVDYILKEGTDHIFYNGNWLPGDEPEIKILGGTVKVRSLSKKKYKSVNVSKNKIVETFSDDMLNKALPERY